MNMSYPAPTVSEVLDFIERSEHGVATREVDGSIVVEEEDELEGLVIRVEFTEAQLEQYIAQVHTAYATTFDTLCIIELDLTETVGSSNPDEWPIILDPVLGFSKSHIVPDETEGRSPSAFAPKEECPPQE